MKKLLVTSILIGIIGVGCADSTPEIPTTKHYNESSSGSGIGMTYGGKIGFDMGGGLVIPFDGSSPGFGFGF